MDGERDPVEELAAEYAQRLRAGERPVIMDYQARHPELGQAIAELFPTIAALEGVRQQRSSSSAAIAPSPSPSPSPSPLPEHYGEFRILRELGRGGMGVVYLAVQPSLGRQVALKTLPSSALLDATARARFQREARLAANLAHPGIVPIHAVGEERGMPWFAMHLVAGVGLDRVIAALAAGACPDPDGHGLAGLARLLAEGQVPSGAPAPAPAPRRAAFYREAALLIAQAADALHHAHRHGVLHRDVKPGNLLLDGEGRVWVSDFGLAKAMEDAGLTGSTDVIGTLRYLAPERFDGQADARSDLYALGLVLFELATGRPAFTEESRSRAIDAILHQGVPSLRGCAPDVPPALERIVLRACARRACDRHPDLGALAADLRAFAGDGPLSAATLKWDPEGGRRRRRLLLAMTALAIAAALLAAWALRAPPRWDERHPPGLDDRTPEQDLPAGSADDRPPRGQLPPPPLHPPPGPRPLPGLPPPRRAEDPLHLGPPR